MKFMFSIFSPALAAAAMASASAQQTAPPAATVAMTTVPNGPMVVMDTSMGRITCQFYQKQAPMAVANFIALTEGTKDWTDPVTKKVQHNKPLYNGTTFHRVIPEFMIQGGDPIGTGMGDPGYTFNDEIDPNLTFDRPGRLAMANSGPNTNGSQFFITEKATDFLNGHYTLFGQCDDASVDVVKAIARVQRDSDDKPLTPVILKKVTIVPEGQPLPPAVDKAPSRSPIVGGPSVVQGALIRKTQPFYPIDAKNAGVSGTVVLQATIGADGIVKDLTVISGPKLLQQAALDAVQTWRYRPNLNGQMAEVHATVSVVFDLPSTVNATSTVPH
jgi:peptidyl-prolyl cis-trans isomerase A (cyclophilin A)